MRAHSIRWVLAALLMASLGSSPAANPGGALFFPKGAVILDGQFIRKMTGIYPGASIQTLEGSGTFVLPDSIAVIAANSQAGYSAGVFYLWCGVITVSGTSGPSVRADHVAVFSASRNPVKFHVGRVGGMIHVISVAGPLLINTGGRENQLLPSGQAVSFADKSGCKSRE